MSAKSASIRDLNGVCLREFFQWIVKYTKTYENDRFVRNVEFILRKIFSFSLHPNCFKRLGSVLAWNSIYTVFRESSSLVDLYTLQLLYVFIESLALAQNDDPSLGELPNEKKFLIDFLDFRNSGTNFDRFVARSANSQGKISDVHSRNEQKNSTGVRKLIERIFSLQKSIWNSFSLWSEASLDVAIRWLLRQCGRSETEARRKSIEIICHLVPSLPGEKRKFHRENEFFQLRTNF